MPRPCKLRTIHHTFNNFLYKPCGVPLNKTSLITITHDEMESIRLADLLGLYHEDAAGRMNISRQTFGNIIASAHTKVADFLLNQKFLKIEGGIIQISGSNNLCKGCGQKWRLSQSHLPREYCPNCSGANLVGVSDNTFTKNSRGKKYNSAV